MYAAIKAVASGKIYFSPSIATALADNPQEEEEEKAKLTTREQVILAYIAQDYLTKQWQKC